MPSTIPAKDAEQSLPRVTGGFRLVRELGRGGMGVVYEAEELSSGRAVALKVLAADLSVSEEAFERFRREARMAAALSDPHCVFVYGAHEIDGSPAIAMELCPGETLEHRLAKREPIPIATAVRWTLEILEGLGAAHRAGVVHRDVKPSNCFITSDDHVKVGDFGLSRSLDGDIRLTQSGTFLGSPLYAAPEQVRGREVDLRSDIYSCGATLYALLTGHPPYPGKNIGEVLARILSESPPPLRASRPEIPAELERVVLRAMEREPQRRFQDHASFRAALEPFVAGEVQPAARTKRAIALALDVVLASLLTDALLFVALSQAWQWAELDPARPGRFKSSVATVLLGLVPALYFTLFEGLAGATPAKMMLGQRVVGVRTGQRTLARCCLRSLVFMGPSLLWHAWSDRLALTPGAVGALSFGGWVANYLAMASTMRRRNGFRGLHEFASGTRVVQARSPFARFLDTRPVPVHPPEKTDRWPAELGAFRLDGSLGPTPTGELLQYVDQNLNRTVWIVARKGSAGGSSEDRRSLARPGRLRWLDSISSGAALFEVFEAPGGASLSTCIARRTRFDWPTAQRVLSGLADELAQFPPAALLCVEQLWIDRAWNPRILDEPLGSGSCESKPPLAVLCDAARLILKDGDDPAAVLPAELPVSAEPLVRKLLGLEAPFSGVEEASRRLKELSGRPVRLSTPTRAVQIAVSAIAPSVFLAGPVLAMFAMTEPIDQAMESMRCIRQLQAQDGPSPAQPMDEEDRRARELVIADGASGFFNSFKLEPAQLEIRRRALEAHRAPSDEDVAWARERIRARPLDAPKADADRAAPEGDDGDPMAWFGDEKSIRQVRWKLIPLFMALAVGSWGIASTLLALILRGGLSLRLFGIGVRNRNGEMASSLRCAWRSLVISLPLAVPYGIGAWLAMEEHVPAGVALTAATALLHALLLGYAIWNPSRSLQDRVSGTRLVSR